MGFAQLVATADTTDCILTLNRIFSHFDQLMDKHNVHKVRHCCEVEPDLKLDSLGLTQNIVFCNSQH